MKKVAIVLIVVSIMLFVVAVIINSFNIGEIDNTQSAEDKQEQIDAIYNRDRNKSKNLVKEHCLDNLCLSAMEMTFERDGFGVVSANMYNNSNSVIPASYVNLNFIVDGEVAKLHFFHSDIHPGVKMYLEIHFTENLFMKAKDYKIEYPSEEEILEYSKS